jgi:hypothetical protein
VQSGLGVGFFYRDNVALGLKEGYLKTIDLPAVKAKRGQTLHHLSAGHPAFPERKRFSRVLASMAANAVGRPGTRYSQNPIDSSPKKYSFRLVILLKFPRLAEDSDAVLPHGF